MEERIGAPRMRAIARDFTGDEFAGVRRAHGVARSMLAQGEPTVAEQDEMPEIARANDFIAGAVGGSPSDRPMRWRRWRGAGAIRASGPASLASAQADPEWILRGPQTAGLSAVEGSGMCADSLLRPRHLAQVGSATERHPGLRGVRCRGAKPVVTDRLDPARRRVPRPGGGHRAAGEAGLHHEGVGHHDGKRRGLAALRREAPGRCDPR